jgi:thiol-disulfide isomerase/thioredoxin
MPTTVSPRRRPGRRLVGAVAALALAAALAGCSATGADEPTRSSGQDGYVGGQKALTRVPPEQRRAAPVVSGPTLGSDRTLSTADAAGKVLVLNVWGSWCAPCREEAPALQAASVETARIAQFVGINSRDTDPAPAEAFVRAFKITYPSIYDNDGSVLLHFSGNLPLSTFPSTLIVDKQGRVAVRIAGPISKVTLVDLIDDVAKGS